MSFCEHHRMVILTDPQILGKWAIIQKVKHGKGSSKLPMHAH